MEYICSAYGVKEEMEQVQELLHAFNENWKIRLTERYGVWKMEVNNCTQQQVEEISALCHDKFGAHLFSETGETLEEALVRELAKHNMKVTTAESCTGGLLAGTITNVAGVSAWFERGYVTYANAAKEELIGVSHDTLEQYGAVSRQTAEEMAEGVAKCANAETSIVTTGIAGPDGGTLEKPVGLVYVGTSILGSTVVEECHFRGNRKEVRMQAVCFGLNLLRERLANWQ